MLVLVLLTLQRLRAAVMSVKQMLNRKNPRLLCTVLCRLLVAASFWLLSQLLVWLDLFREPYTCLCCPCWSESSTSAARASMQLCRSSWSRLQLRYEHQYTRQTVYRPSPLLFDTKGQE